MPKFKLFLTNTVTQVHEFEVSEEKLAEIRADIGVDPADWEIEAELMQDALADVKIRKLTEEDGWLVDNSAWEYPEVETVKDSDDEDELEVTERGAE